MLLTVIVEMCVSYCITYFTSNGLNLSGDYVSLGEEEAGTVGRGQAEQCRENRAVVWWVLRTKHVLAELHAIAD